MEDGKNFDASSSWFATNVRAAEKDAPAAEKFAKRIQLVEDATALKEPERIPMCPMLGALPYIWKAPLIRLPCMIFLPHRKLW